MVWWIRPFSWRIWQDGKHKNYHVLIRCRIHGLLNMHVESHVCLQTMKNAKDVTLQSWATDKQKIVCGFCFDTSSQMWFKQQTEDCCFVCSKLTQRVIRPNRWTHLNFHQLFVDQMFFWLATTRSMLLLTTTTQSFISLLHEIFDIVHEQADALFFVVTENAWCSPDSATDLNKTKHETTWSTIFLRKHTQANPRHHDQNCVFSKSSCIAGHWHVWRHTGHQNAKKSSTVTVGTPHDRSNNSKLTSSAFCIRKCFSVFCFETSGTFMVSSS